MILRSSSWVAQHSDIFQHTYVDQSPLVARRLGFASLPLAVLAILIGSQSISLLFPLRSDSSGAWSISSLSTEEIIHCVKWGTMGILFWLWYEHLHGSPRGKSADNYI